MLRRLSALFLVLSLAGIGAAQRPDFYHRPSPLAGSLMLSLATFQEVQKELNLTSDDSEKIDDTLVNLGQDVGQAFQSANNDFGQLTLDITKLNVKYDGDYLKTLKPEQATRLKELFVQFSGAAVIVREDFAKDIALTDDQKAKAKQLQLDEGKKVGDLFQAGEDPTEMGPAMKKLQDQFKLDLAALLTDDQKKKLEDMKGAKFEFKKPEPPTTGGG